MNENNKKEMKLLNIEKCKNYCKFTTNNNKEEIQLKNSMKCKKYRILKIHR